MDAEQSASAQRDHTALSVGGMHCNACVILTESELIKHPKILSVKSSLMTRAVEICGDFGEMKPEDIAKKGDFCAHFYA